jgi:hypothetical protein
MLIYGVDYQYLHSDMERCEVREIVPGSLIHRRQCVQVAVMRVGNGPDTRLACSKHVIDPTFRWSIFDMSVC